MTSAGINLKSTMYYIKNIILVSLTFSLCLAIIMAPKSSSDGVIKGLGYCLNILIPSLFPFMFIASFIVKADLFKNFQKAFSALTKFLFYLPGCTAPTIFLSLIGGYPVGARGVKSLLESKKINHEQANRMMCFCVSAGPAFIIGVVGSALLKNTFYGILMFTVQIITSLLIGFLCAVKARTNKEFFYFKKESFNNANPKMSQAIISSCEEASKSMFGMCALVVIFSSFISILQYFNVLILISENFTKIGIPKPESLTILTSILEITYGCAEAAYLHAAPAVISFALGYGGMCVHLQIAAILSQTQFNYSKFIAFRLFNGIISGILTYVGISIFGNSEPVFSTINQPLSISNSSTAHGSVALIALCLYFIFAVNAETFETKNL